MSFPGRYTKYAYVDKIHPIEGDIKRSIYPFYLSKIFVAGCTIYGRFKESQGVMYEGRFRDHM
jgi:hypothetical protein